MASKTVHSLTPYYLSNIISFCFLPKLTSLQPDSFFFFSFSLNSSFYLRALLYLLPKMLFPQVDTQIILSLLSGHSNGNLPLCPSLTMFL